MNSFAFLQWDFDVRYFSINHHRFFWLASSQQNTFVRLGICDCSVDSPSLEVFIIPDFEWQFYTFITKTYAIMHYHQIRFYNSFISFLALKKRFLFIFDFILLFVRIWRIIEMISSAFLKKKKFIHSNSNRRKERERRKKKL